MTSSAITPSGPSAVLTQDHQRTFSNAADGLEGSHLDFSNEVLHKIFEYLTPTDLGRASRVCQNFYTVANDGRLWGRFVTFYDEPFWNQCIDTTGLDFTGTPSMTCGEFKKNVIILSKVKTEGTPKEGSDDIVVLTLPKGLSMDILEQRAKTTTKGNKIGFRFNHLSDTEKNACAVATEVVFMKKFIIHGSRKKDRAEHEALAKDLRCEIPDVKAVAALAFLTYIGSPAESPTRLLSDKPSTYSRCKGNLFFVGGFAPGGPDVIYYHYDNGFFAYDTFGLVPLRKF